METKNSKEIIILVLILSLLVVGLGGYLVYDKFLSNDNVSEPEPEKENENQNNESNNTDSEEVIKFLAKQNLVYEEMVDYNLNNKNNKITFKYYTSPNEDVGSFIYSVIFYNDNVLSGVGEWPANDDNETHYLSNWVGNFDDKVYNTKEKIVNLIKKAINEKGYRGEDTWCGLSDLPNKNNLITFKGADKDYLALIVNGYNDTCFRNTNIIVATDTGELIEKVKANPTLFGSSKITDTNYGSGANKKSYYIKDGKIFIVDFEFDECQDITVGESCAGTYSCQLNETVITVSNNKIAKNSQKKFGTFEYYPPC